jgi:TrmH family RNA methyltransferase
MTRQIISSAENPRIKLAAALRQKKYRDDSGLFVVEGIHLVEEAITAGWVIEQLFLCQEHFATGQLADLTDRLLALDENVFDVSAPVFKKIAETDSPQGILAIVRQQNQELGTKRPENILSKRTFWVVLDAVQDPGNVGTIVRTADAAGASGVILTPGCADLYAGKTVRASMGSLFHLPVCKAKIEQCLKYFAAENVPLYVADANSAVNYDDFDLTAACAVVFGNEGAGVSEKMRQHAAAAIRIPIIGKAESLNVASAAAVILFEAARQRGFSLS